MYWLEAPQNSVCWTHCHSGAAPGAELGCAAPHAASSPLDQLAGRPTRSGRSQCLSCVPPGNRRHGICTARADIAREGADTLGSPEIIPIILGAMQVTHRPRRQGFRNFSTPVAGGAAMAHGLQRTETASATDHTRIGLGVLGFYEGPVPPMVDLAKKR